MPDCFGRHQFNLASLFGNEHLCTALVLRLYCTTVQVPPAAPTKAARASVAPKPLPAWVAGVHGAAGGLRGPPLQPPGLLLLLVQLQSPQIRRTTPCRRSTWCWTQGSMTSNLWIQAVGSCSCWGR
jgi:hypothetical protein